jgi:hypothetical protein
MPLHPIRLRLLSLLLLVMAAVAARAVQPRIWFVDNTRSDGDGSSNAPFPTIAAAVSAAAAGDVLYVVRASKPYREHVVLGEGQLLAGHGADLSAVLKEREIAVPAGLPDLPVAPVIDGGEGDALTLASGSVVIGMHLRTTSGRALVAAGTTGVVFVRDTVIETANGTGIVIEGGDADIDFTHSPVTATAGAGIVIRGRTGGLVHFHDGSTVTVTGAVRDAFVLESNQGELAFADEIQVRTTGARGLVIRNSSRVALTSEQSTVTTSKAAAVEIADTAISVVLRSVTADGAGADVKRGISVENAPGTFRVSGGAIRNIAFRGISIERSSGVTFQNMVLEGNARTVKATTPCATLTGEKPLDCGAAIYLAAVTDVSLSRTRIDGTGHTGILGDGITNLTLDTVTIENAGDEPGEHGIAIRDLLGRSIIFDSVIKDSSARQLYVSNRGGEGSLEIRKTRFDGGPPPAGQQGMLVELADEAKWSLAIDDSDFTQHFSDGVAVVVAGKSAVEIFIHNSRFASTGMAVNLVADGEARLEYRLTGNTIRDATGPAISLHTRTSGGSGRGIIADNIIGVAGAAGSGSKCGSCSGIAILATRGGRLEATIRGNTIRQVDGYGIRVNARGTADLAVTIAGNIISEPNGADVLSAIALQAGALKTDTARLCADLSGNRISGNWGIALTGRGGATISLAGLTGDAAAYLREKNHGAAVTAAVTATAMSSCF